MKNETLIGVIVGAAIVWFVLLKKRSLPFNNFGFNPPGHPSNTSTADGNKGSDIFQGYSDYSEEYYHVSGLSPVNEGPILTPNLPVGPEPMPKPKLPPGNFANGDGSGYQAKLGIVTNNVRLLPGKVNSGNRQGITKATLRNT